MYYPFWYCIFFCVNIPFLFVFKEIVVAICCLLLLWFCGVCFFCFWLCFVTVVLLYCCFVLSRTIWWSCAFSVYYFSVSCFRFCNLLTLFLASFITSFFSVFVSAVFGLDVVSMFAFLLCLHPLLLRFSTVFLDMQLVLFLLFFCHFYYVCFETFFIPCFRHFVYLFSRLLLLFRALGYVYLFCQPNVSLAVTVSSVWTPSFSLHFHPASKSNTAKVVRSELVVSVSAQLFRPSCDLFLCWSPPIRPNLLIYTHNLPYTHICVTSYLLSSCMHFWRNFTDCTRPFVSVRGLLRPPKLIFVSIWTTTLDSIHPDPFIVRFMCLCYPYMLIYVFICLLMYVV